MTEASLKEELSIIVDISRDFGAKKVFLFGSCLEDIDSAQDIDIAVSGVEPGKFFKYYGKISMAVKDEVDILDLDDVREHLHKRILSKGRMLYEQGV
jgi:predicted nucleotidyltransferase